jgi:PIN domain nuclease of toxin-antitoxin system
VRRLLLDSNVLVRWLVDDLASEVRQLVSDPTNEVYVSAASPWELAIKVASGKLRLPNDLAGVVVDAGFTALPITGEHGEAAALLPLHHRDPFDRILIAQAQIERLTLVSRDRAFERYDVELMRC